MQPKAKTKVINKVTKYFFIKVTSFRKIYTLLIIIAYFQAKSNEQEPFLENFLKLNKKAML